MVGAEAWALARVRWLDGTAIPPRDEPRHGRVRQVPKGDMLGSRSGHSHASHAHARQPPTHTHPPTPTHPPTQPPKTACAHAVRNGHLSGQRLTSTVKDLSLLMPRHIPQQAIPRKKTAPRTSAQCGLLLGFSSTLHSVPTVTCPIWCCELFGKGQAQSCETVVYVLCWHRRDEAFYSGERASIPR